MTRVLVAFLVLVILDTSKPLTGSISHPKSTQLGNAFQPNLFNEEKTGDVISPPSSPDQFNQQRGHESPSLSISDLPDFTWRMIPRLSIDSPDFPFDDTSTGFTYPHRRRRGLLDFDDDDESGLWTSTSAGLNSYGYDSGLLSGGLITRSDLASGNDEDSVSSPPPSSECANCGISGSSDSVLFTSSSSCSCEKTVQPSTATDSESESLRPDIPVPASPPPLPETPVSQSFSEMSSTSSFCSNCQGGPDCSESGMRCYNGVGKCSNCYQGRSLPPPPTIAFHPPTSKATVQPASITSSPATAVPPSTLKSPTVPPPRPSSPPSTVAPSTAAVAPPPSADKNPSSQPSCLSCVSSLKTPSPFPSAVRPNHLAVDVSPPAIPHPLSSERTVQKAPSSSSCPQCTLPSPAPQPSVNPPPSPFSTPKPPASQDHPHPHSSAQRPGHDIGSQHPVPIVTQTPSTSRAVSAIALPIRDSQPSIVAPPSTMSSSSMATSRTYSTLSAEVPVTQSSISTPPSRKPSAAPSSSIQRSLGLGQLAPPSAILFGRTSPPPTLVPPAIPGLIAASGQL